MMFSCGDEVTVVDNTLVPKTLIEMYYPNQAKDITSDMVWTIEAIVQDGNGGFVGYSLVECDHRIKITFIEESNLKLKYKEAPKKIIQLHNYVAKHDGWHHLVALCEDGSVYATRYNSFSGGSWEPWVKLPEISNNT